MKNTIIFAAAACALLAACTKIIDPAYPEIPAGFEKGRQVTLSVSAPGGTKVSSATDATTGEVSFKWEAGDKIKVIVGTESSEFSLSSGAGSASATFVGAMPADGESFDVQYPVTDPDLSEQTYVAAALPKDRMKFTATGCTLGTSFELKASLAALRLNLYGLNREVSSIVITNTTSSSDPKPSYTLVCTNPVRVGSSPASATPFDIVVPSGEGSWNFKVDVTSVAATQNLEALPDYSENLGYTGKGIIIPSSSFSTTSAKTFAEGEVLDMPAKPITIIWAPVNCGYESADGEYKGYPYGRMYQWGRKYGQGYKDTSYEDADYPTTAGTVQKLVIVGDQKDFLTSHPDGNTYNGNYYCNNTISSNGDYKWYNGSNPDKLWNTNEGTGTPVSKSAYDPCPDGWRVPTKAELEILKGTKSSLDKKEGTHGSSQVIGSRFDGLDGTSDNYVFLPVAGSLNKTGVANYRGTYPLAALYYWSSSVIPDGKAYVLVKGGKGGFLVGESERVMGFSVRCVKIL